MYTPERPRQEKTVLDNVGILRVGAKQKELLPQLASLYYKTWHAQDLCESLSEATDKMAAFNPKDTYVVISKKGVCYALIQTLPVDLPSLTHLPLVFPTYQSVEETCKAHAEAIDLTHVICFSINVLPGYQVGTQSLVLYLLNNLPIPRGVNQVAYSRFDALEGDPLEFYLSHLEDTRAWGPVGIHEIKGVTTHIIKEARWQDFRGGGCNVVVVYPKNPEEAAHFNRIKLRRQKKRPETVTKGNVIAFADTIDLCQQNSTAIPR